MQDLSSACEHCYPQVKQCSFLFGIVQLEDFFHELPFPSRWSRWVTTLELSHISLPFRLSRKAGKPRIIRNEVEVIHCVHNHEQAITSTENLHIQDSDLAYTGLDLRPHPRVDLDIFLDQIRIVRKIEGLAIAFHTGEKEETKRKKKQGRRKVSQARWKAGAENEKEGRQNQGRRMSRTMGQWSLMREQP